MDSNKRLNYLVFFIVSVTGHEVSSTTPYQTLLGHCFRMTQPYTSQTQAQFPSSPFCHKIIYWSVSGIKIYLLILEKQGSCLEKGTVCLIPISSFQNPNKMLFMY